MADMFIRGQILQAQRDVGSWHIGLSLPSVAAGVLVGLLTVMLAARSAANTQLTLHNASAKRGHGMLSHAPTVMSAYSRSRQSGR